MKTFKAFIQEGLTKSRSQPMEHDEAIEFARKNCAQAFKINYPVIVRGVNSSSDYSVIRPSESTRTSANTTNEYTVLIDNAEEWSQYPKRSKSIICGTIGNVNYVDGYGEIHIVIPVDSSVANIGVCPAFDMWESFEMVKHLFGNSWTLEDLNSQIRTLMDQASDEMLDEKNTSYPALQKAFGEITEFLRKDTTNRVLKNTFPPVSKGQQTFEEYIRDCINPKKNGFKLQTYSQLARQATDSHEVWLDSPSLLLKVSSSLIGRIEDAYLEFAAEVNTK